MKSKDWIELFKISYLKLKKKKMQKYDISKDEFKKRKFRKDDIDEFKGNIT
jgi:hypothetical protein